MFSLSTLSMIIKENFSFLSPDVFQVTDHREVLRLNPSN